MELQTLIVLLIVAGCVFFLGRNTVATLMGRAKKGCHGCQSSCTTPTKCDASSTENRTRANTEFEGSDRGA